MEYVKVHASLLWGFSLLVTAADSSALCPLFVPLSRENFQRLQQDLAEMIVSGLEKGGVARRGKTLSTRYRRREGRGGSQGSHGLPEYFHLADPSTYL